MTIYRCTILGGLANGEVWQVGLHTNDNGAGTITNMLDAWSAAVLILWSGNGGTVPGVHAHYVATTAIENVRVASLDPGTGRQTDAVEEGLALAGSHAAGPVLPPNVAIAVSTRGASVNRRSRGRFFLPAPAADVAANDGSILSAAQGDFATSAQGMFDSLITSTATPVIWHRDLLTFTTITRIDVGNVFDTQRRRRNRLTEQRQVKPLP